MLQKLSMKTNSFCHGFSGLYRHFTAIKKIAATTTAIFVLFLFIVVASGFLDSFHSFKFSGIFPRKTNSIKQEFNLQCPTKEEDVKSQSFCPTNYPETHDRPSTSNLSTCPSYFRWIPEDLRHWKETGITKEMIERARETAHFRLVIVNGKAYVETYKQSFQTRDKFNLWGILQLLRFYPGRLPDLELMFNCNDHPALRARDFQGPNSVPPPLFSYCSDGSSADIVFPDWSFWGWGEINIRPWSDVLKDIEEGNKRIKWKDRIPYAYWKGNPSVSPNRKDLLTCNVSEKNDWSAHLYVQDWVKEIKQNFRQSNLGDQCTHRYKIYIEGRAWSVSEKYILACDSMTLIVRPQYYDFFSRGLMPMQHYWPIRDNSKCTSIKFAVQWGNTHTEKAQAIAEAASRFVKEDLKMDYVYDYMFHLLNEYAKLLKYKPSIPAGATELCSERLACNTDGTWRKFMEESLVKAPSDSVPCSMPLPYDPPALKNLTDTKIKLIKQVEAWENEYYGKENKP